MTNVFVPSNDLAVSQLFFIFVISKTIYNQTIMLSFVCDYSEGAHPRILERLTETNLTTRTFGVFCWPPRHTKRRGKRFGAKVLAAA